MVGLSDEQGQATEAEPESWLRKHPTGRVVVLAGPAPNLLLVSLSEAGLGPVVLDVLGNARRDVGFRGEREIAVPLRTAPSSEVVRGSRGSGHRSLRERPTATATRNPV